MYDRTSYWLYQYILAKSELQAMYQFSLLKVSGFLVQLIFIDRILSLTFCLPPISFFSLKSLVFKYNFFI